MLKLSVIIPVFNEKDTIRVILDKVRLVDFGDVSKEIIVVDDFSTDSTREMLISMQDQYKTVFHDRNYGKGRAIRTGLRQASGDWVIIQDADLEYEPNEIKLILNKMQEPGVDAVYGSRRLHKNYFKARHSGFIYAVGGILLTILANLLYRLKITDEATCYKMIKTDLLREIDLKCEGFEFCPEVTAKLGRRGIKIHEVPISYNPRHKAEGKKIKLRDGLKAIWTLIKYRF